MSKPFLNWCQIRGNLSDLARHMKVTLAAVQRWRDSGVPVDRITAVSAYTGIAPAELRPDLARTLWPQKYPARMPDQHKAGNQNAEYPHHAKNRPD